MKLNHNNKPEHNCKEMIKEEVDLLKKEFKEAIDTFADLIGDVLVPFRNQTEQETVYKFDEKTFKIVTRTKLVSGEMKMFVKPDVQASDSKGKKESVSPSPASIAPVTKSPHLHQGRHHRRLLRAG